MNRTPKCKNRAHLKTLIKKYVIKVTSLEPFDKKIVTENKTDGNDIYAGLIYIMKESTFEYYNTRMALGLECA